MAEKLTLRQPSRRARLSRRRLAFLIRTGVIDADLEDGSVMATSHSIPTRPKTSLSTLRMGSARPAAGLMMTFTRISATSLEVRASGRRRPLAVEPVLLERTDPPLDVRSVRIGHGSMRHDEVHRLVRGHPPGR